MEMLIAGNSHAGALRLGFDATRGVTYANVSFFVQPGRLAPNVKLRDGLFYPARGASRLRTTGIVRKAGLRLADFDVVCVVGFGLPAITNANLLSGLHPAGSARSSSWVPLCDDAPPVFSHAFIEELMLDVIRGTGSYLFLRDAVKVFEGAIYVMPTPAPSINVTEDDSWLLRSWYGLDQVLKVHAELGRLHLVCVKRICQEISSRINVVGHPQLTTDQGGFTRKNFEHSRADPWHMNARYGRMALGALLASAEMMGAQADRTRGLQGRCDEQDSPK
jgi:hypothetical protein